MSYSVHAPRPYRPSNGTEGEIFQDQWCEHCVRDNAREEVHCEILMSAMMGDQPREWIYKDCIPTCLAFSTDAPESSKCEITKELF